ncbi:hypothetical protein BDV06DRAFT_194026 [Aspergillus oleicola]
MASEADAQRDRASFSFSQAPQSQPPFQPQYRPPSTSSFSFSPSTPFTFTSPPTRGVTSSASPPSFSFSPPPPGTFVFSSNSTSTRDTAGIRTPRSPGTPSDSGSRIFTPTSSRESTTSTARALFTILDLGTSSPRASDDASSSSREDSQGTNSAHLNVSTYRDLFSATPSPQPDPTPESSQSSTPNADSTSPSRLGSVTTGVRNLVLQSIENPLMEEEQSDGTDGDPDSGSEGNSDEDSTYNMREEQLPQAPIYDPRLQNALREVRGRLADLVDSMTRSEIVREESTRINELYNQVGTASRFSYPESRIIGFIGDSGSGKSTLINALVDHEGLARSSGNGAACTSVVTEFRHVDEAHPRPFTIVADFMNTDEMKELLRELVRAYRMRHTRAFDEVTDQEECQRITLLSQRAWTTLDSLFPHETDLTEEFLSTEDEQAEGQIITRLEAWAFAGLIHRPGGPEALRHVFETGDIYDCRETIDTLTVTTRERHRPAIWPFVRLITVYLRSPVLRTGLVVADLPGFRDLNYARERATERYLRNTCDEVFVVSPISRCRTDPSIQEIMDRVPRDQPRRIVCTMSETRLDAEESIRDPEMRERVGRRARQLLDQIRQASEDVRRNDRRRRRSSGDPQRRYANQAADANDELQRLELELKRLLMESRNELAIGWLSTRYQPNAKVFCVSSRLYTDHRGDFREQATEYIRLSGIPELRQYCQLVPAAAQFKATSTFLQNHVPALLLSLNQWVLAGSNNVTAERAQSLRRVLEDSQRVLQLRLLSRDSCLRSMRADLDTQFRNSIVRRTRNSQGRWQSGAIRASRDWATIFHSTYAAFCRKFGTHQPVRSNLRYWNNEILQDAREELEESWDSLLAWLDQQQDVNEDQIEDIFDSVSTSIRENTHLAPAELENFLDNLEIQERLISDAVQRSLEDLVAQSMRIIRDSLDGQSTTSYIAEIMRPAYNMCNIESGTGSDARRKAHMDQHVRSSQIFTRLLDSMRTDYTIMMDDIFTRLKEDVDEKVQNIIRDMGTVTADEGEVAEATRDPGLAQRVRAAVLEMQAHLTEAHLIVDQLGNNAA